MICQHLRQLEEAILASGFAANYRGQVWTANCREWVYFACYLDEEKIRKQFDLPACVVGHVNDDTKSGRESGFVCTECNDGIIGIHRADAVGRPSFPESPDREHFAASACLLCYGTLLVGEISDISKCDPSYFGSFRLKLNPDGSEISRRICEFIDFTQEFDRKMGQDPNHPPDDSGFARFDDLIHSGAWVVRSDGEERRIEPPYFMDDGQVTWQFSDGIMPKADQN